MKRKSCHEDDLVVDVEQNLQSKISQEVVGCHRAFVPGVAAIVAQFMAVPRFVGKRVGEVLRLKGGDGISCIAELDDGRIVCGGRTKSSDFRGRTSDGFVRSLDLTTGAESHMFTDKHYGIYKLKVVDKDHVLFSTYQGKLCLWNTVKNKRVRVFAGHKGDCVIAVSKDSTRFVSGSSCTDDDTVKVWDRQYRRCIASFPACWVRDVAFIQGGERVVATFGKGVREWDIETGGYTHDYKCGGTATAICVLRDETRMITASFGKYEKPSFQVWDLVTKVCVQEVADVGQRITHITQLLDSSRLVCGTEDDTLMMYDPKSHTCKDIKSGGLWFGFAGSRVRDIATTACGRVLVLYEFGDVEVWK